MTDAKGTLRDLVVPYANLGVQKWRDVGSKFRLKATQALGIQIAEHEHIASRAVVRPFSPNSDDPTHLVLIPMPCCPPGMDSAFFTPVTNSSAEPSFDLVTLTKGGQIAFRFEPGDAAGHAHGYDHVQLSRSIGRRAARLPSAPDWLPDSYPAFPIPGQSAVSRFLSMVVAMHGYPDGVRDVLTEMFSNRDAVWGEYLRLIDRMLEVRNDG